MKCDIIIAGVGGQGIISIASVIGMAAVKNNLYLKQSEVHGMSQRGGAVQSNLRISDKPISSDLIPFGGADLIISVEPMESLRYIPYLSKDGWIVTNTTPFVNITDYPNVDNLMNTIKSFKNHIAINADSIAKELGSERASNMVMLGAAAPFLNMSFESIENGIRDIFGRKGEEIVNLNLSAINTGKKFTEVNR